MEKEQKCKQSKTASSNNVCSENLYLNVANCGRSWSDGQRYLGDFYDGKKEGKGHFIYPDGSTYEGEVSKDVFDGQGSYKWKDGKQYEGTFLNGLMHGSGIHKWANGKVYEGAFINGRFCLFLKNFVELPSGKGIMKWPDGRTYDGDFFEGKQHGYGLYTNSKGKTRKARFENGSKKEWID